MKTKTILIASLDTGFINGVKSLLAPFNFQTPTCKNESCLIENIHKNELIIVDVDVLIDFVDLSKLIELNNLLLVINRESDIKIKPSKKIIYKDFGSQDFIIALSSFFNEGIESYRWENIFQTYDLTEREIEILKWVVNGLNSKEIGHLLQISHRTAEGYRNTILKKTKTKNISELFRLFHNISK